MSTKSSQTDVFSTTTGAGSRDIGESAERGGTFGGLVIGGGRRAGSSGTAATSPAGRGRGRRLIRRAKLARMARSSRASWSIDRAAHQQRVVKNTVDLDVPRARPFAHEAELLVERDRARVVGP